MAYTNVWNSSLPTGSEAANTLATIISSMKVDLQQRFIDIFNMANFTADPLRPGGLKFFDTSDAKLFFGDNSGTPRNILLRDKADTTTYGTIAYTGITLTPPTLTGASTPFLNTSQTWNNAATTFTGVKVNITNTASSAASLFVDYQVATVSKYSIDLTGKVTAAGGFSGTIQTAAQANITSLGTLTALALSGTLTAGGNIVGNKNANKDLLLLTGGASGVIGFYANNGAISAGGVDTSGNIVASIGLIVGSNWIVSNSSNTTFTQQYAASIVTITYSSTPTVNWNSGNVQKITLGGNPTLTFSNPIAGGRYMLELIQDGTGSRTVTWPTIKWTGGGTAPTLTTTAGKKDLIGFVYDGTDYIGSSLLNA